MKRIVLFLLIMMIGFVCSEETTGPEQKSSSGSIVAWGANGSGECDVPSPNTGFEAVACGSYHSLAIRK